ncbi:MAG: hypothetical protein JWM58_3970 [Rhizobium sp.]|nr:hypothetical protein [Rhizobium sp.]
MDRSVAYRDAIDIGMLISAYGFISHAALTKVAKAYGDDIERKLVWSSVRLREKLEREYAAQSLQMNAKDTNRAAEALHDECLRLWPERMRIAIDSAHSG